MAKIATIESFAGGDFEEFEERLQFFFLANDIGKVAHEATREQRAAAETKKAAILISLLTAPVYSTLKSLCLPDKPASKKYDDLVAILTKYFQPDVSSVAATYLFQNCRQECQESVRDYQNRLKRAAVKCDFKSHNDRALRDQFIAGLKDDTARKEILSKTPSAIETFHAVVELATARETALQAAAQLTQPAMEVNVVSAAAKGRASGASSRQGGAGASSTARCYRCNKTGHMAKAKDCPARDASCRKCGRKGHFAVCCRSQAQDPSKRSKPAHYIAEAERSEPDEYAIGAITKAQRSVPPVTVEVSLSGVPLKMEVDTGAEISVVPASVWQNRFQDVPMRHSDVKLHAYGGKSLSVVGEADVAIQYNQETFQDTVVIVEGNGQPLFGRNWLTRVCLDWHGLFSSRSSAVYSCSADTVVADFPAVFQEGLGTVEGRTASIQLQGSPTPKCSRARPVPYAMKDKVETELARLEEEGIITPVRQADWASPIVIVRKKNNQIRLCADFKTTINKHIDPHQHPIPDPSYLLSQLSGGRVFSKLDLSQAYAQLRLDENSRRYCVIATHKGLYAFNRLPFGVSSAPAIWQQTIEDILRGIDGVVVFYDDILIWGANQEEHDSRLRTVLRRFEEAGLRLRREKCLLSQPQVSYIGYTVCEDGLRPSQDKVEAVQNAPKPQDVSTLRSFLGLVNFFGRFIPNCSTLLHPLNRLLRKDVEFEWSEECDQAFQKAKEYLMTDPVMAHYDVSLPLLLECDASSQGIGAVLCHIYPDKTVKPIVYVSRALSSAESHYSQIEREALAIVFAVRRLHSYIFGRRFTLRTDHKPLVKIFGRHESLTKTAASRLQRWSIILSEYDYDLEHISGKDNVIADCLSRLPAPLSPVHEQYVVNAVSSYAFDPCELLPIQACDVAKASKCDRIISLAMSYTLNGWPSQVQDDLVPFLRIKNDLNVEHGCLLWGSRVIIPCQFRGQLLQELHAMHLGINRMKSVARSIFWWPGLDQDIGNLVATCGECQVNANRPTKEDTHHWAYPNAPFERVHLDYAEYEEKHFLVLVDAFSKWIDVFELGSSATTTKSIYHLLRFIANFGLPRVLVTDNGPQFVSHEFREFCRQNGIEHQRTPPYHPSSNGQCERMVQELKKALKTRPANVAVPVQVARFLLSYRSTPHTTTRQSPASLLFKKLPTTRLSLLQPSFANSMQHRHAVDMSPSRQFTNGDYVYVFNARPGSRPKWLNGTIVERLGPLTYLVSVSGLNRHVHIEHLRLRTTEISTEDSARVTPAHDSTPLVPMQDSTSSPADSPPLQDSVLSPPLQDSTLSPPTKDSAPPVLQDEPQLTSPTRVCTPVRRNPPRERKAPTKLNL